MEKISLRILLCHNQYQITGGAEFFFHEVGRVLKENNHEVAFFSAKDAISSAREWDKYSPEVTNYASGTLSSRILAFPGMIYNHRAKENMARLIDDFRPDLIHVFAIYVKLTPAILDAAREVGVPVIMSCNDYKHICPNYKLFHHGHLCEACKGGRYYQAVVNRCCHDSFTYSTASSIEGYAHNLMNIYRKNVHTFLFASGFMAHKTEEFWGKKTFRWKMLRNPYDAPKHTSSNKVGDYALYFGRLIDEKGANILLDAASLIRDFPLIVVGDGPDLKSLRHQAAALGMTQVQFVGAKWGDELDQILRGCRFVVVPSLWHENFPYVILQSFAVGKPVVGSNRGGIPELVEHGKRGLIYEAKDPAALAEAMRVMMDNDRAQQMGTAAKHYVDAEFNDKRFYANLMEIYRGVLQ